MGPPVCFLNAIPREIFSIKLVKPAPRGNQGCTSTIPPKTLQFSKAALAHVALIERGDSSSAGSMRDVLGKLIKAVRNTNSELAIRSS